MYPHLIEVHTEDGSLITFNIDHVIYFNQYSVLMTEYDNDGGGFNLIESYEELKQLIRDAGCHIAKKDPRLDDEPLTMKDLKGMVGEPVWNSNTRKWYIIHSVGNTVAMANPSERSMLVYIKSDLSKYPLYRMKVTE